MSTEPLTSKRLVAHARWRVEATAHVAHRTLPTVSLPADRPVTAGRADRCGIRLDHPAVSSQLATFETTERGCVVTNGRRTRMDVANTYILRATFTPAAAVLVQAADTTLTWDLDVRVEVALRFRPLNHGDPPGTATDRLSPHLDLDPPDTNHGTDLAGNHLHLTALQRHRLGALFAWLIEGTPRPDRLIPAAAERSGDSIAQINTTWVRTMEYVNRHRDIPIERIEDLGYHLVEVAGVLGPDDLSPPGA